MPSVSRIKTYEGLPVHQAETEWSLQFYCCLVLGQLKGDVWMQLVRDRLKTWIRKYWILVITHIDLLENPKLTEVTQKYDYLSTEDALSKQRIWM